MRLKKSVTLSMNGREYTVKEGDIFQVTLDIYVEPIPGQTGKITGDLRATQSLKIVSIK